MKLENTKQIILEKALELFASKGYDAVSVAEISNAVGIKASSLYNHYPSKKAIFEAIVENVCFKYDNDIAKINIHVKNADTDTSDFINISVDTLFLKLKEIFLYSIHNKEICLFRKMLTIEQFRSTELASLYTTRYVTRLIKYHQRIFTFLIEKGKIKAFDPEALAYLYVSPVLSFIGICDRDLTKEKECIEKLKSHVILFYKLIH